MNIVFVRAKPSPDTIGLQHVMIVEPLELEVLGAAARAAGHACTIVDLIIEKKPFEYFLKKHKPDVVAVTGYITNVPEMKEYCRRAKSFNQDTVTVAGGVHCEVCPDDLDDPAVDFRVVRNAVSSFPALLEAISDGSDIAPAGVLVQGQLLDETALPEFDFTYPLPDRSLTEHYRKRYFYIFHDKVALIKTAFGCPYSCEFCFCRRITRCTYAERPLRDVMRELSSIREKEIYIVDDDFLVNRQRVIRFLDALEEMGLKKRFLLYGRSDFIAANPDIIRRFRILGLRTVIVGLESFSDKELSDYAKGTTAAVNEAAMRILSSNGIDCFATIIANPGWDRGDFEACARKLIELGVNYVNLQPYTPLPGTGAGERDDLIVSRKDYHKWDLAHLTVMPARLSPSDYYREIVKLYERVLFQPAYLLDYARKYSPRMWFKMLAGSIRVKRQYEVKIREVLNAENIVYSTDPV